ncbi:metallopeptidase MepB [Xylariaceae sp. FL1019]|nr:metallopeptidase MepB [Xylariaceae sp. FL1019]
MSADIERRPSEDPPRIPETASAFLRDTRRLISYGQSIQADIKQKVQPANASFENTIEPLARAENVISSEYNIVKAYRDFGPDPELRRASTEAINLMEAFAMSTTMDEDLFALISAVAQKEKSLSVEQQRLLDQKVRHHTRNGLHLLPGPGRDRLAEIRVRLRQLESLFNQNSAAGDSHLWLTTQELTGVPATFLLDLIKGAGENQGRFRLNITNLTHTTTALSYVECPEVRRRVYVLHENRCVDNVPVFQEIMQLRSELALLLGYPNFAALRLEDRVASTPETVSTFTRNLAARLTPIALKEIDELKQFRLKNLDSRSFSDDGEYYLWDHALCDRLMIEREYSIDKMKLSEYFSLSYVVETMLQVVQQAFGIEFAEMFAARHVWHDSVRLLAVQDNDKRKGEFMGYLYLDLYSREGKKRGAFVANLVPGFSKQDGSRQPVSTALVCNFAEPSAIKPTLLRHEEVVVLFHELGHAIHDLVSRTVYSCFHGPEATPEDFGEAPSQMLEYWCWHPSILKRISRHYSYLTPEYYKHWRATSDGEQQPPETIPAEMVDNLRRTKNVNRAIFELRQLAIAEFDMLVHQEGDRCAIKSWDLSTKWNDIRSRILPLSSRAEQLGEKVNWSHAFGTWNHLVGSYGAGYYSYLFSKVFAADLFHTAFEADPMDTKIGLSYRYRVLEKGGAQDPMELLQDFLGRKMSSEAFERDFRVGGV